MVGSYITHRTLWLGVLTVKLNTCLLTDADCYKPAGGGFYYKTSVMHLLGYMSEFIKKNARNKYFHGCVMPVERSRKVLAFVMRIYKLANGHFTWLPCTKSCLGRLSFPINCAYVENPFLFLGTLVLPVENLNCPLRVL